MQLSRLHGPDVLRGFAACGVVFFHVLYLSGIPINHLSMIVVGRFDFFVRLFFALSAFSIAYAYSNRLNSVDELKDFYFKRFRRIAPLFYFILLWGTAYSLYMHSQLPNFYDYLLSATFVFPFVPGKHGSLVGGGWSIGIEWMFYAFFPILFATIRGYRSAFIAWLLFTTIAILGRNYFHSFLGGQLREYGLLFFLSHLQYFIIGIAAFHIYHQRINAQQNNKQLNGVLLVATIILTIIYFRFQFIVPEELALSISIFILVFFSILNLPAWLDNSITRHIGLISYSIYLVQFPVIQILSEHGFYSKINSIVDDGLFAYIFASIITLLIVIAVSMLTYRWIEKPGQNFYKFVNSKRQGAYIAL